MTRVDDLITCYCCCRYTLSDDSMGEQVRSQPIVTNRSEISCSTSNYVETLTLLFTKVCLEPYQSQTEVCLQCTRLSGDYHSEQKKKRGENKLYCSCQNFILADFLLYKCLTICKHTHTKDTRANTQPLKSTRLCTHTAIFFLQWRMLKNLSDFHKEKHIYLFIWVQSNYRHYTVVLGCDISL